MNLKTKKDVEIVLFLKTIMKIHDDFLIKTLTEGELFKIEVIKPLTKRKLKSSQTIIKFLENIRKYDHFTYRQAFYSDEFRNKVICPLEKLIFAKATNEEKIKYKQIPEKIAEKLQETTQGKTFDERWEKIEKIINNTKKKKSLLTALDVSVNGNKKIN